MVVLVSMHSMQHTVNFRHLTIIDYLHVFTHGQLHVTQYFYKF